MCLKEMLSLDGISSFYIELSKNTFMVGLFDWKIILTALITLGALLVALGNHPAVKEFFGAVGERLSGISAEEDVARNIAFNLTLDSREDLATETKRKINITIGGKEIFAVAKDANINTTNKEMRIRGYTGYVAISGNSFEINGSFERFEVSDVFVVMGDVYSNGIFERAEIDDLALKELMTNSSGVLFVNDDELKFSEGLKIEYLIGRFVFYDRLTVEGLAKKIATGQITIY